MEIIEQNPVLCGLLAFYCFCSVVFVLFMLLWRDEIIQDLDEWKDEFKDWEDE